VQVIAGPAGVGKTATANEVSAQLRAADVPHAVVDTDALDDVYPVPADQQELTERHLAFIWKSFLGRGTRRLILTGVYMHRDSELTWIRRATAPDRLTLVRLTAAEETLAQRVRRREIGSARDGQLIRTLQQMRELDEQQRPDVHLLDTERQSVVEVARRIGAILGW
ncbi:MAG: hypothetical protein QOJ31_312, partial [Gaiellales bacterium]|nr:hypothetical protein [Gaiellales bacterium]